MANQHRHQLHSPNRARRRRKRFRLALGILLAIALVAAGVGVYAARHTKAPQDATKTATSSIKITTVPTGATIFLDGKQDQHKSNTTLKTPAGLHTVKLQLHCYDDQEIKVDTQAGKTTTIDHTFVIGGKSVVGKVGSDCQAQTTYTAGELTIYKSDKYNFTIAYPKEWAVQTDVNGIPHFFNKSGAAKAKTDPNGELQESLAVLVLDNPQKLDPEAWYKTQPEHAQEDQSQIKQEAVTINGKPAYRYETPYGFVPYLNTVFTRGDKTYIVQQFAQSPDRTVYDQIVQTFHLP